ncbi:hypothetical protein LB572_12320 [Mesorhizobium sp. BH1-1-5]|uniref:hypothetical protein n=1 Tax=Mesorhizobium sp. BH1-1-5 TaxID=2876661 RepID=UPI001CCCDF51|nr:hypothetical protein [Mesorhizobium sp. BH1-1-5]MBZ9987876.1 hypothetical protein [Mesorhizobium sp. BH1-1-5]
MADDSSELRAKALRDHHVDWLVKEAGVTAAQAHELIELIGMGNLPSLRREAFLLKKSLY